MSEEQKSDSKRVKRRKVKSQSANTEIENQPPKVIANDNSISSDQIRGTDRNDTHSKQNKASDIVSQHDDEQTQIDQSTHSPVLNTNDNAINDQQYRPNVTGESQSLLQDQPLLAPNEPNRNINDNDNTPSERDRLVNSAVEESQPIRRNPFRRSRQSKNSDDNVTGGDPNNSSSEVINTKSAKGHYRYKFVPKYRTNCLSMFQFLLKSNLRFGLGYRIDKLERFVVRFEEKYPNLRLDKEADGLAVGITILSLTFSGTQLSAIVKPYVKVHVVSLETGHYIGSRNLPAVAPVSTTPCTLFDSTADPQWNQELVVNSYFSDLVSDDTLLLFEVLDEKPSLTTAARDRKKDKGSPDMLIAKRIAWGYLLPISVGGDLNVGFSDDWRFSSRRAIELENQQLEMEVEVDHAIGGNADSEGAPLSISRGENLETIVEQDEGMEAAVDGEGTTADPLARPKKQKKKPKYPWDKPSIDKLVSIQLFSYRQYDGFFGTIQRKIMGWPTLAKYRDNGESSYPDGVPEVYVQWRLQTRLPMEGSRLVVRLGPRPAEIMPIVLNGGLSRGEVVSTGNEKGGLMEEMKSSIHLSKPVRRGRLWAGMNGAPKSKVELMKLRSALLRRTRTAREQCVVPDKLLYRYDVGEEGAMVVSFSSSGHILAIAARGSSHYSVPLSREDVVYSVSLYDTDLDEEVWVEPAAHHGVVYEIRWTRDDRYMLSCSGDGTCKVWDMRPVLYRSSNTMGFNAISSSTSDPSANTAAPAAQAASKPPSIMYILSSSPPVYTYTAVFQEQLPTALGAMGEDKRELPRIITGGADGRLRVWDDGEMKGLIVVSYKGRDGKQEVDDSPHEGQVNSIVIDERSRFLISGDAMGEILAWRADATGWYQLLRKFRKEVPLTIPGRGPGQASSSSSSLGCVLSLVMNPDKHKGQMVALMRQPAQLKVINMNTYKTHCTCAGFSGYSSSSSSSSSSRNNSGSSSSAGGVFARAQISADGRYVVAGSTVKSEEGMYRLQVWDSQTGHSVHTQLSDLMFAFPIRSISWHPTQHLLAIAMVGHGAAVAVYAGDKEIIIEKTAFERTVITTTAAAATTTIATAMKEIGPIKADSIPPATQGVDINPVAPTVKSQLPDLSVLIKSEKTREMLERIRAAKASKQTAVNG